MSNEMTLKRDNLPKEKLSARQIFIEYGAAIALVLLIIFNSIFTRNFMQLSTLFLIIKQATPILFLTVSMTLVISSGGIDISAGSMMAFCGIIVAMGITDGGNFLLYCLIALLVCAGIGTFNGYLISKVRVQPIILTLVMQIVMRGVTVLLASSSVFVLTSAKKFPEIRFLGLYRFPGNIPVQTVFFVIIVIFGLFIVNKTTLGKQIEALGGNEKAARLSGIDTTKITIIVYALSGVLAGMCGILEMSRNGALDPNELGKLYELDAIAGVAIGGTSMKGGKMNMLGSVMGCIIMIMIGTTVNMNGIPFAYSNIIKAGIIIVSLAIQREKSV